MIWHSPQHVLAGILIDMARVLIDTAGILIDTAGILIVMARVLIVMARLVRATSRGTVLVQLARTSRAMTGRRAGP
jgi:hypothetical protein